MYCPTVQEPLALAAPALITQGPFKQPSRGIPPEHGSPRNMRGTRVRFLEIEPRVEPKTCTVLWVEVLCLDYSDRGPLSGERTPFWPLRCPIQVGNVRAYRRRRLALKESIL